MKIFVINGYAGSGKTTFSKTIAEQAEKDNVKIGITSMIHIVKFYASQMGYEGTKTEADRLFLHRLKIALADWKDIPMNSIRQDIEACKIEEYNALMVDAREYSDIRKLRDTYGAYTVLIDREEAIKHHDNDADNNIFNCNLSYDFIIKNNDTLEDFKQKAINFYNTEIKPNESDR